MCPNRAYPGVFYPRNRLFLLPFRMSSECNQLLVKKKKKNKLQKPQTTPLPKKSNQIKTTTTKQTKPLQRNKQNKNKKPTYKKLTNIRRTENIK